MTTTDPTGIHIGNSEIDMTVRSGVAVVMGEATAVSTAAQAAARAEAVAAGARAAEADAKAFLASKSGVPPRGSTVRWLMCILLCLSVL